MLRIGLTGAGGVGKGTLIKEFIKKHPEFTPLFSQIKNIGTLISPNAKNYDDMNLTEKMIKQFAIVTAQIEAERVATMLNRSYISERSRLDYLCFTWNDIAENEYQKELSNRYENLIINSLKKNPYDILIYIPIEFEPSKNDLKYNSWKERDADKRKSTNDKIYKNFLHLDDLIKTNCKTKRFALNGTVDERVEQLEEVLNKYK